LAASQPWQLGLLAQRRFWRRTSRQVGAGWAEP
jgi:hypothetical protein